jgi:hypothetical protein
MAAHTLATAIGRGRRWLDDLLPAPPAWIVLSTRRRSASGAIDGSLAGQAAVGCRWVADRIAFYTRGSVVWIKPPLDVCAAIVFHKFVIHERAPRVVKAENG